MLHITVHNLHPSLAPTLILFKGIETGQRPVPLGTSAELPCSFVEFTNESIMAILSAWQAQVSGVHGSGSAKGAWMFSSELLRLAFLLSLDREPRRDQSTR